MFLVLRVGSGFGNGFLSARCLGREEPGIPSLLCCVNDTEDMLGATAPPLYLTPATTTHTGIWIMHFSLKPFSVSRGSGNSISSLWVAGLALYLLSH